ncbi:MAG: hypothetical protein IJW49_07750 [Clostridia bacterium]|nr:hypothetical protein [Clostridia bacterium]
MVINIEVKNRVATYRSLGSDPVCGSNNDTVKFHFDEEWQSVGVKTARFVWGNRYYDREFEGDTCAAPMFVNLTRVYIGVYAGEPVEEEPAWATTKAEVPYRLSVRCGYHPANPESGNGYTNEAKGYALEAQAAAELAIAAAASSEGVLEEAKGIVEAVQEQIENAYGLEEVGRLEFRMRVHERLDDEGNYVYKLSFGEHYVDDQNGSVLLQYAGEYVSPSINHSMAETIISLMSCPVTRIVLEHSDPLCVLRHTTVYDGRSEGIAWKDIDTTPTDGTCRLYDTAWPQGGVRLVCHDAPQAANLYGGPYAVFLQFPEDAQKAIEQAALFAEDDSHYLTCTMIGYQ